MTKGITGSHRCGGMALALVLVAAGCAPGLEGQWQGTGERGEARFFQFALDLKSTPPSALWLGERGAEMRLAVCSLVEGEGGTVEFRLDPETPALSCDEMTRPMVFKGAFGRDVLAGDVLDATGKAAGRFRAFRRND